MQKVLTGLTFTTLVFTGLAAASGTMPKQSTPTDSVWRVVAKTSDTTYKGRLGSFKLGQNKDGLPIATLLGQQTDRKSDHMLYFKWSVTTEDCLNGFGKLVYLDTKGSYLAEIDFVSKGESAASAVADLICDIYKDGLKEHVDEGA
jgi:hypothetical protein